MLDRHGGADKRDLHMAGNQVRHHLCPAAIRHMNHIDAGHHVKQLASQMRPSPLAGRRHVQRARIGFGVRDELGKRSRGDRWMHHHDKRRLKERCDGLNVADEVEIEVLVKRRISRLRSID